MRCRILLALTLTLATACGCSSNSPPAGAPLGTPALTKGKVVFADGTPMKGGMVNFYPVEVVVGSKMRFEGGALVNEAGQFVAGRNDTAGFVPGEYKVTVGPRDLNELTGSNSSKVPKIYREKDTTPLTVTVEDKANDLTITVK